MWGVSGKVVLEVKLKVPFGQQLPMLDFLPAADNMVHLEENRHGFGSVARAKQAISWFNLPQEPTLVKESQYARFRRWLIYCNCYMASEGMDTYSVCPTKGLLAEGTVCMCLVQEPPIKSMENQPEQSDSSVDNARWSVMHPHQAPYHLAQFHSK